MKETMVTLTGAGDYYTYNYFSIALIGDRWYVSNGVRIVADFATLDEVREWLYHRERVL